MSIYEFEYASVSVEDSTPEWGIERIVWVPMGEKDREAICLDYNDEGYSDYSLCTQWVVWLARNGDADEEDSLSVVAIPCASDGSSPCDTPFYEIFDEGSMDEFIQSCREDRAYSKR